MATINTSQQFASVSLAITNAAGKAAKVDGVPSWASSDETQVSVTPAADGMSAVVAAVGPSPAGQTARITVTADADLGAGVTDITGVSEDITVVVDPADAASVMTLSLGSPSSK